MPVTIPDDFLWENTGHAASTTSVVVTHPDAGGTTAGTTVLVFVRSSGAIGWTAPAGWARDQGVATHGIAAFRLDNATAGQTTWTITRSTSGNTAWYMAEVANLALDESFELGSAGTNGTLANGGTRSTATTALNAGSNVLAFAVFGSTKAAGGDTHSWSGYTNGFTERADFQPVGVVGDAIAVAAKVIEGQGTFESTATFATSTGTPQTGAIMFVYRGYDASINAPLAFLTGFEFGTYGGMGNISSGPLGSVGVGGGGTVGTNCRVIAGAAKNGSYGLEVDNTGATNFNVVCPALTAGTFSASGYVQAVSGTGTPVALFFEVSGRLELLYDVTNEKFGLQWSTPGTVQWQTGTSPLGSYPGVQIRAKFNGSTWHADWWIETGTGDGNQTSPPDRTGTSPSTSVKLTFGAATTQTAKFYYDDWVISRHYGAYPLGLHVVRLLVPETTGATVSGTSTNFSKFTANGTLAAWASDAGTLLDEVPPTVSASSDGVVQTAVAASDYAEFPMTTYTLASDEIIAGVRFLASLWGGTGSGTGTLGWRGYDGLTETTFVAASTSYDADSLTAISATYPLWDSSMWSGAQNGAWSQTRLNAAAIRMGFSTDATPDMGASAVYLEVAIRKAPTVRQNTVGDDVMTLDLIVNPYNSATTSYIVTNNVDPAGPDPKAAQLIYSISGTPQTPITVNPGDPPSTVDIHADNFGDVNIDAFGPA